MSFTKSIESFLEGEIAMNKQTYLTELRDQMKSNNVEDIEEIIAEYEEHFTRNGRRV